MPCFYPINTDVEVTVSLPDLSTGALVFTPSSVTVPSDNASFTIAASSNLPLPAETVWTWYVDGTAQAGFTGPSFTFDATTYAVGSYTLSATAADGRNRYSGSMMLTVTPTAPAPRYTVSYDVAGGSNSVAGALYLQGEGVTVPSYAGVRAGYVFDGWQTDDITGSVTVFDDSALPASFTMPGNNVTLSAVWTPSIVHSPVTGLGVTTAYDIVGLTWTDPASFGFAYVKVVWYPTATPASSESRNVVRGAEGTALTGFVQGTDYTIELYAVYTDGTNSAAVSCEYPGNTGVDVTITLPDLTTGALLFTPSSATIPSDDSSFTIAASSNLTLPAGTVWTWYVNGAAQAGITTSSFDFDATTFGVGSHTLSATAYDGRNRYSGSMMLTVTPTAPAPRFTVSYDVAGGSLPIADALYYQNDTVTVPSYAGVRAGYVFDGWQTDDITGSVTVFDDGALPASFTMPANNVTLSAVWTPSIVHSPVTGLGVTTAYDIVGLTWTDPASFGFAYVKVVWYPTLSPASAESRNVVRGAEGTALTGFVQGTDYTIELYAVYTDGTNSTAVSCEYPGNTGVDVTITLPDLTTGALVFTPSSATIPSDDSSFTVAASSNLTLPVGTVWTWYVNGAAQAGFTTSSFDFDATTFGVGSHTLSATAYDGRNRYSGSMMLTVTPTAPAPRYTVSYDVAGGSLPIADALYYQNDTVTVPVYGGTRSGYAFDKWQTDDITGSVTVFEDTALPTSFTMPGNNVTLSAVWTVAAHEPVTALSGTAASGMIGLSWTDPVSAALDKIRVVWYRTDTPSTTFTRYVARGQEGTLVTGLTDGTEYTFVVDAVYTDGASSVAVYLYKVPGNP